jgi:hypothetical protein
MNFWFSENRGKKDLRWQFFTTFLLSFFNRLVWVILFLSPSLPLSPTNSFWVKSFVIQQIQKWPYLMDAFNGQAICQCVADFAEVTG